MRILLCTGDGGGNVPPTVAVARELLRRGHTVRLLAGPYYPGAPRSKPMETQFSAVGCEVVSPEAILFEGEAEMVVARTLGGGDIAFLTGHAPFLGALTIGVVRVKLVDGSEERVAVHGGFVEVSHDVVTILSDVAELSSQIDVDRARRAKEAAERSLMAGDDAECEAALRRAHVRLELTGAA